jgi:serine/threonine protein kinase
MPFVASGTYGCVFRPHLKCKDKETKGLKDTVGKVFETASEYRRERNMQTKISSIDPYGTFTVAVRDTCVIDTDVSVRDDNQVKKCDLVNITQHSRYHQIIYRDAGKSLKYFLRSEKGSYKKFRIILKALVPFVEGLKKLAKNNLVHSDIKDDNIMFLHNKLYLIDFGIASLSNEVYNLKNKNVLKHQYPYYPPEFKLYIKQHNCMETFIDDYLMNFAHGIKISGKSVDLVYHIKYSLGIDIRSRLKQLFKNRDLAYDPSKIDIYGLGIVLLMLFIWCDMSNVTNVATPREGKVLSKRDGVVEATKHLIAGMIDPFTRDRYSHNDILKALKQILSI